MVRLSAGVSTASQNQSGMLVVSSLSQRAMASPPEPRFVPVPVESFGYRVLERAESLQMEVCIAEQGVDNGQTLEVVANVQLFGHAHATVQLHGILANKLT